MTDFSFSWQKRLDIGGHTQDLTNDKAEREADRRAMHELQLDLAVAKNQIKNEHARIRENATVREQLRALSWAKSGHAVFARDSEHGQELDVSKIPEGWPAGVEGDAFLSEQFAARGWADE